MLERVRRVRWCPFLRDHFRIDELTKAGVEVLYDDRDERPGVKFNDADLIGIPLRIVVGARSLKEGQIEYQGRRDAAGEKLDCRNAIALLSERIS